MNSSNRQDFTSIFTTNHWKITKSNIPASFGTEDWCFQKSTRSKWPQCQDLLNWMVVAPFFYWNINWNRGIGEKIDFPSCILISEPCFHSIHFTIIMLLELFFLGEFLPDFLPVSGRHGILWTAQYVYTATITNVHGITHVYEAWKILYCKWVQARGMCIRVVNILHCIATDDRMVITNRVSAYYCAFSNLDWWWLPADRAVNTAGSIIIPTDGTSNEYRMCIHVYLCLLYMVT